ncbi:MAG: GAF domain-containing protein [Anaerolineae bacterium]|nr:GAF domain-containing protein [Anaerolineae bacterium]
MNNNPKRTPALTQECIADLCEELTQLALMIAESREIGTLIAEELHKRLPTLRSKLVSLEEELASQEYEREELEALYGVSEAIGSSLNLPQVLNEVMDQIIRLTGAERSFLMLVDPATGELEFQAARNMDRETIASSSFEISRTIVNQVANTGKPIVTTNAQMDPRFKTRESVIGYSLRSILCVPLRARGEITGVIYADNRIRTGLFSDHDRDLLTTFAGQAAVAIENARLFANVVNAKVLRDNVFASIINGVITTNVDGHVTLCNRAAQDILGVSEESTIGAHFAEAFPALESNLRPLVEEVKTHGEPVVDVESEITLPGREPIYLRNSLSPLKDANEETQGIAIVLEDLTEQRKLESRYQWFQRYVSPAVIERLPADPQRLKLGGQRQEITSMFADIRGFTDFSLQHDPETLVDVLNQYLEIGAKAVLAEDGTLDKFMGDAVVAFFNAPLPQPDHILRAIRTALKIREGVDYLHQQLPPAYQLSYGIGITVGDAVVGHIGTAQRVDYTAIGPSVNLARRLQEAAAPGQILLTRLAYKRIQGHIEARLLPPLQVEGINEPIETYELIKLK